MKHARFGMILVACASALAMLATGCSKSSESAGESPSGAAQATATSAEASESGTAKVPGIPQERAAAAKSALESQFLEKLPEKGAGGEIKLQKKPYTGGSKAPRHEKYLADPFELADIPASPYGNQRVAVVASDKASLYPDSFASMPKDLSFLEGLKKIAPIPFGTMLPIYAEYSAPEGAGYGDLVRFDGLANKFYATEYKGKKGMVFGADIVGPGGPEPMARQAYFYNKPAAAPSFVRTIGQQELPKEAESRLAADYLAFDQNVQYVLDLDHPDDLVSAYQSAVADRGTTIFVTTDLMVHCLHLLFDRMLSDTEEKVFIPKLKALIQGYLDRISELQGEDGRGSEEYTEALGLARTYFTIGKRLLAMAPPPEYYDGHSGGDELAPKALGAEDILSIDDAAKAELELILNAGGFSKSPSFYYIEDYSQFKPRGHYAKNERLSAYFRAMTFFGRVNLYMDFSTPAAAEVSEKLAPVAVIANRIYADDAELRRLWREVFDPITYLVGESDDISFDDVEPLLGEAAGADLEAWMAEGKLIPFVEEMAAKLRAPRIQGNIAYGNANAADAEGSGDLFGEAPRGWRLFGQRFVLDSSWTDRLTGGGIVNDKEPPDSRTMAMGLDVAAALGSAKAFALLEGVRGEYPKYAAELDEIRAEAAAMPEGEWEATFYTRYLDLGRKVLEFASGSGFYFTQKPKWDIKALQTGQAAWAELRHDTILYVKQSYAERAGGGDEYVPTSRTRPFDRPIHYVEPNLRFFHALAGTIEGALPLLEKDGFLTPAFNQKFMDFYAVAGKLASIVELEVEDRPISKDDNEFIVSVPSLLARIVLPSTANAYMEDLDQLKMALVADVHTDSDAKAVLEVATGRPLKIYVALNDGQGGKRVAVGFGYSYYEFAQPMSDRLSDGQWKAFVYDVRTSKAKLEEKRPAWLRGSIP